MKATVTIRKDKKNRFGQSPIVIQLSEGKILERIALGINIEPEHFDFNTSEVKSTSPNHRVLNTEISEAKKKLRNAKSLYFDLHGEMVAIPTEDACKIFKALYHAENIEEVYKKVIDDYGIQTEVVELKHISKLHVKYERRVPVSKISEIDNLISKYLRGIRDEEIQRILDIPDYDESDADQKHFMDAWAKYQRFCNMERKQSTYSRIPNNLKILTDFCKKYNLPQTFEAMTEDFGREFKYYLTNEHLNVYTKEKGVSDGTVHNIQKSICAFLNWSFKQGFNKSLEFKKWDTKKPKSDQHYLKEPQLIQLAKVDLTSQPALDKARDLFLFAAYTGMRHSDVIFFRNSFIEDGMIKYVAQKNKKRCQVKVLPIVQKILDKNNGVLPKQNDTDLNLNIKIILKKIGITQEVSRILGKGHQNKVITKPLCDMITYHSSRRSFINLMISKGIQVAHLSSMVGNDINSLMTYYKTDSTQIKRVMSEAEFMDVA